MDCDTSDQWSGIELLRVFFLTLTFFQQNFQALIPYNWTRVGVSVKNEYAITHYPASVSAGSSRQVTYFEVSKTSVAAAGTIQG